MIELSEDQERELQELHVEQSHIAALRQSQAFDWFLNTVRARTSRAQSAALAQVCEEREFAVGKAAGLLSVLDILSDREIVVNQGLERYRSEEHQ